MRAGIVVRQAGVCLLTLGVILCGCAGQSAQEAAPLRPPENEAQPQWHPGEDGPNHLALARDLIRQGHYTVALRQIDLALQADERTAEPHHLRGVCQRETGDLTGARKSFRRAIRLDHEYAPAYDGLGIVFFKTGQYPEAHKALSKAVALDPANPDFLNNLGVLEMRTQKISTALTRFEQCLRIAPDHGPAKNNLAECLVRLGRGDEALVFLERHFPPAAACNNLGAIYERVGSPSRARDMFLRALEQDPDLSAARRNLNRLETKEDSQP
jgi:Tfp pilus assembly protein PilF